MIRHPHSIIVLLILVAAGALGMVTSSWTYPLLIAMLLALHICFGLHLQSKPDLLRKVALGIPFAVWFRLLARNGVHEGFTRLVQVDVLFMVGFYALAYSTYHLLCIPVTAETRGILRAPLNKDPAPAGELARIANRAANYRGEAIGGAIVAIALAGVMPKQQIITDARLSNAINVFFIVFIALTFIEMRRAAKLLVGKNKASSTAKQAIALGVVIAVAVFVQDQVILRISQINRTLTRRILPTSSGANYRKVTTLGSIALNTNDARANEIVVTLWSDTPFPYLRGSVNDSYKDRQWSAIQENTTARRIDERDGRSVFSFKTVTAEIGYVGTIYTAPEHKDTLFLPVGTYRVSAFADKVFYSDAFTAQVPDAKSVGGYGFYEPVLAKNAVLPGDEDTNFTPEDLQIPDELRGPIKKIANSIMDPKESAGRNAQAIQRYFESNFKYSTNVHLVTNKDPILEFLENKKEGHCEYFASATTLLLRAMNIPARYVTGFVVQERGLNDSCFVARRKDAHAWVEMYTPEAGWKTLETTPSAGIPTPLTLGTWDRLGEYIRGTWERIYRVLQFGGLRAVFSNIWNLVAFIAEIIPLWAWIAIAVIGFTWSQRDRIQKITQKNRQMALTKEAKALQRELLAAEKILAKYGVTRDQSTPVGHFMRHVQAAPAVPEPVRVKSISIMERYLSLRFRQAQAQAASSRANA